ncbi:MAG: hypothetical protein WC523_03160 [Patescibacteria group bacterium]|jgi:hypothetical protein
MKLRVIIFLFSFLIFAPRLVLADLIDSDKHQVRRCVKIVNLDKFPDLVLIGFYTGPMVSLPNGTKKEYIAYKVKNNECLTKGYKFNKLDLFWTTSEKFTALNLDNLKLNTKKVASSGKDLNGKTIYYNVYSPKNLELLVEHVESADGQVSNTDPLIKETLEYSLIKNSKGKLSWYKSKRITDYNDGSQQRIETFQASSTAANSSSTLENQPGTKPARTRVFWRSVFCFFKIFPAKNCQ